jgi:hypothetical protein
MFTITQQVTCLIPLFEKAGFAKRIPHNGVSGGGPGPRIFHAGTLYHLISSDNKYFGIKKPNPWLICHTEMQQPS